MHDQTIVITINIICNTSGEAIRNPLFLVRLISLFMDELFPKHLIMPLITCRFKTKVCTYIINPIKLFSEVKGEQNHQQPTNQNNLKQLLLVWYYNH